MENKSDLHVFTKSNPSSHGIRDAFLIRPFFPYGCFQRETFSVKNSNAPNLVFGYS